MNKTLLGWLVLVLVAGCSKPADPPAEKAELVDPPVAVSPEAPPTVAAPVAPNPVPPPPVAPPEVVPRPTPALELVKAPAVPPPSSAPAPLSTGTPDTRGRLRELASSLVESVAAQPDPFLKEISVNVGQTVQKLSGSAAGDPALQGILQESLQSLAAGKDLEALAGYAKVESLRFSSEQAQWATDAANSISAFVVQRGFTGLANAKQEVSLLVNALRYGDMKTTVKATEGVAGMAGLTPDQQAILNSIAARAGKLQ